MGASLIESCYEHRAHFQLHSPHHPSTQHHHAVYTFPFRLSQILAEAKGNLESLTCIKPRESPSKENPQPPIPLSTGLKLETCLVIATTTGMVPVDLPEHIPNLVIVTLQIPRRNKPLDTAGGIIVLEDLQLDPYGKDAIDRNRIFSEVTIPKRKIQLQLSLAIFPLVIILSIDALIVQHKNWVLTAIVQMGKPKLDPA